MSAIRLSVVVMAFDEVASLAEVVGEIRGVLDALAVPAEILIVDDGSVDGTGALADRLAAEVRDVRVEHHPVNGGLGAVYRTGFARARGELITFFPADGQFPASILESFLPAVQDQDMVLGYVARRDSLMGRVLSLAERGVYRLLLGRIPRFQGVFIVRREALARLTLRSEGRGWAIVMELLVRAARAGWRMRSLETPLRPRRSGVSKVQNARTVWANLRQVVALRRQLSGGGGGAAAAIAAFLLAAAFLGVNVAAAIDRVPDPFLDNLPLRFWQDLHMAEALYLFGEFPVTANEVVRWKDDQGAIHAGELHRHLAITTAEAGIRPWEFWRVVRESRFRRPATRVLVNRFDDSGRPVLLGLAFRARGGIAPFLLFWLGPLMALPLLAWAAAELVGARAPAAAVVLLLLLGAWPFLADTLSLAYSTAGFNVLALVATIPLVVHAGLRAVVRGRALLARTAFTGIALAVCVLVRGGALFTVGGAVLALAWGARRSEPARGRGRARRLGLFLGGVALLSTPVLVSQAMVSALVARTASAYGQTVVPPQRHALWFGLWTGLGDFDRTKGYRWQDRAASDAAVAEGGTPLFWSGYDPSNEPILRRLVLRDIRADPLWYAGILARRLWATVSERKLWPWPPWGGRSLAALEHEGEGAIDAYYGLATPPDRFGIGGAQVELPVPLLIAPAVVIVAAGRWRRSRATGSAIVLGALAAAALPLPVLVTTASAIETEAFALVYVVAAALVVEIARSQEQDAPGQTR